MADDDPISYLALPKGAAVLDRDGDRVGTVEHVLQDDALDVFDGVVVRTAAGLRFVDARRVGSMTVSAVSTTLTRDEADHLPEPDGTAVYDVDPDQLDGGARSSWFGRFFKRDPWMRERS